MPEIPFPVGAHIVTLCVYPAFFETMGLKHIGVATLNFLGDVTSWDTLPFFSTHAVSYQWSLRTERLSLAVYDIFGHMRIVITTLTLHGYVKSPVT